MKKWLIPIGIIAILFVGGYFLLSFYAVKFIQAKLQKVVGPGFTITEIKIKPTCLYAKGILYEDPLSKKRIFQIEEMRIYPALSSFLKGTLRIRKWTILRPMFFFYRSQEGVFMGPWVGIEMGRKGREISNEGEKKKGEPIPVEIGRIRIQNGSIDFEDRKMEGSPAQIELRGLDLEIKDIQYPFISAHTSIELKGKMKGRAKEGSIESRGWIDLKTLDMETTLKIQDTDVKIFEPYYRKRVSAEIEDGYVDMDAKVTVRQKMIDAPGQLELINLYMKEEGIVFWVPAKKISSQLKHKGNRMKVQFHIKGNIDDPRFNLRDAFLTGVAISFIEALGMPIKVVGKVEGTEKGAEGLVEGLKSIEELFKKKKEKKR